MGGNEPPLAAGLVVMKLPKPLDWLGASSSIGVSAVRTECFCGVCDDSFRAANCSVVTTGASCGLVASVTGFTVMGIGLGAAVGLAIVVTRAGAVAVRVVTGEP